MKDPNADAPLEITVFGGSGGTGGEAVNTALDRGHRVRAIHLHVPDSPRQHDRLSHHQADVLSDDLGPLVAGANVVLSCLGVGNDPKTLMSPPPLYSKGTARICDAMEAQNLKRLVVMSASFVETKNRGPIWFKLPAMAALHNVFDQMGEMEEELHSRSAIDWTAVRPGWLMEGEATDNYTVQANVIPEDMIRTRRADVAHFMVDLAESGDWVRRTPALARKEDPQASSPKAVAEELLG